MPTSSLHCSAPYCVLHLPFHASFLAHFTVISILHFNFLTFLKLPKRDSAKILILPAPSLLTFLLMYYYSLLYFLIVALILLNSLIFQFIYYVPVTILQVVFGAPCFYYSALFHFLQFCFTIHSVPFKYCLLRFIQQFALHFPNYFTNYYYYYFQDSLFILLDV